MGKKKVVAIWAPLRYANYGDDLQAIVFAKYIQSFGYDVKLFQLEESLAKKHSLKTVHTVDELCTDVNLCIIAGGALLTPFLLHKRILSSTASQYEKDFKDLYEATKKYKTKFCAISIGGDGKVRNPKLFYSKHRIHFFKSPSFINGTVRLDGDVNQMKKFGKDFKYYPDCLFQTSKFIDLDKSIPSKKFRVGLNLKKGKHIDGQFVKDLFMYAENNDDTEFYFMTTHMDKIGLDYQYLPKKESKNIRICKYESPEQLLSMIGSMDILVSSMLHMGLTGLTVETPFISYRGPGKTKTFLESIKGEWAIVDNDITFAEMKAEYFNKPKELFFNRYDLVKLEKMIEDSINQFHFCKKIVERHA